MTVKEAFKIILADKDLCSSVGLKDSHRRVLISKFNKSNDKEIGYDTMKRYLIAAGWQETEPDWTMPKEKTPA